MGGGNDRQVVARMGEGALGRPQVSRQGQEGGGQGERAAAEGHDQAIPKNQQALRTNHG